MDFPSRLRTCLFLADEAEEAATYYVSLIPGSEIENTVRVDPDGPALVVEFRLGGAPFMTLSGNGDVVSTPTWSISVLTADQVETDRLWGRLIQDGGEAGQCGWLCDRFGIHWQIVPEALPRLMGTGDPAARARVQQALMAMQKIEIAGLEAAAAGAG